MGGRPEINRGPQAARECSFFSATSRSKQGSTELLLVVQQTGMHTHNSRLGVCMPMTARETTAHTGSGRDPRVRE